MDIDPTEPSPARARTRPCVGLELPPGAAGLHTLMPALSDAIEGTGPAIALLPSSASAVYGSRIRRAVSPGAEVPSEVAVVVSTSGSTGDPRGVMLSAAALRAAAEGFGERFARPAGHQWVAALPLAHVGGLMVAVRAVLVGTTPVATASLGGADRFTVQAFADATARARKQALSDAQAHPLAVSLVPPMLATLDAAGAYGWDLLSEYDTVLIGGAAVPAPVVERLRSRGVPITLSYGMTETCGGAVFDGRPLPGVAVCTDDVGRLSIGGAQVASGYRDGRDPGRWSTGADGLRWFRTDDVGRLDPDGSVAIEGRIDDVVQVAGTSVSMNAVRSVLGADPRVREADVVALDDPVWGNRLVAAVIPADPEPAVNRDAGQGRVLGEDLAAGVEAALGPAARPRPVHLFAELPRLDSGKVDRRSVADLVRAGQVEQADA